MRIRYPFIRARCTELSTVDNAMIGETRWKAIENVCVGKSRVARRAPIRVWWSRLRGRRRRRALVLDVAVVVARPLRAFVHRRFVCDQPTLSTPHPRYRCARSRSINALRRFDGGGKTEKAELKGRREKRGWPWRPTRREGSHAAYAQTFPPLRPPPRTHSPPSTPLRFTNRLATPPPPKHPPREKRPLTRMFGRKRPRDLNVGRDSTYGRGPPEEDHE